MCKISVKITVQGTFKCYGHEGNFLRFLTKIFFSIEVKTRPQHVLYIQCYY